MRLIDADALKINLETFATVYGMSDFYSRHEVLDSIRRGLLLSTLKSSADGRASRSGA